MTESDKVVDKRITALFSEPAWSERFPPFLTTDQAAELAQVPKQTIYAWSSRGLLGDSAVRAEKHLRIIRNEFVKLLITGKLGK